MFPELKLNSYRIPKNPCGGCTDRCVNCHATCEKYISWKAECDKLHKERIKECEKEHDIKDYFTRRSNKIKKRREQRK